MNIEATAGGTQSHPQREHLPESFEGHKELHVLTTKGGAIINVNGTHLYTTETMDDLSQSESKFSAECGIRMFDVTQQVKERKFLAHLGRNPFEILVTKDGRTVVTRGAGALVHIAHQSELGKISGFILGALPAQCHVFCGVEEEKRGTLADILRECAQCRAKINTYVH